MTGIKDGKIMDGDSFLIRYASKIHRKKSLRRSVCSYIKLDGQYLDKTSFDFFSIFPMMKLVLRVQKGL